jgi:hypothetical protein
MDSIDLEPQPILGIGSDNYSILKRFGMESAQEDSKALPGQKVDGKVTI